MSFADIINKSIVNHEHFPYMVAAFVIVVTILVFITSSGKAKTAIDSEEWRAFPLIEIEKISHDVRRFRFGLQTKDTVLGLPIGQHISLKVLLWMLLLLLLLL